jgi:hypothetical protein
MGNWQRVGQLPADRDRSGWVFTPRAKKLALQVSNKGIKGEKEYGLRGALLTCKYCKYMSSE